MQGCTLFYRTNESQAKGREVKERSVGEPGVGGEVSGSLLVAAGVVASEEIALDPHDLVERANDCCLLDERERLFREFENGLGDEIADPGNESVAFSREIEGCSRV